MSSSIIFPQACRLCRISELVARDIPELGTLETSMGLSTGGGEEEVEEGELLQG